MTNLFTNPYLAILLLVLLVIIFNHIFTKSYPLDKIQLKNLDYVWLTLSATAIFGLAEKNRIQLNEIELSKNKWFHDARSNDVLQALDTDFICFTYNKTQDSPANIDEIQKMTDSICVWTKHLIPIVTEKIKNNDSIKIIYPKLNDSFLRQYINRVERTILEYNQSNKEILSLKSESMVSDINFFLQLLSPLLLLIGLAIRFSKTTVEIKLEKTSANSKQK